MNMKYFPFTNDYVFDKVLSSNEDIAKHILKLAADNELTDETIQQMHVRHQEVVDPLLDAKSSRFDVYLFTNKSDADMEMQTVKNRVSPKRARYYVSAHDVDVLEPGEPYDKLPKIIIVFICTFDPFDQGYRKYIIKERVFTDELCKNDITNACKYDNECVKIFLNSKQAKYNNVSKELKQFLDYVNTQKTTNVFTERIEEKVSFINKRDRRILMSFQEDLNDAKKAGIEEGKASGFIEGQASGLKNEKIAIAKTMIAKNFNNELISEITKLSFDEIKDLRNESIN